MSLYEPPILVADECYSYSIDIRDLWTSMPTAEAYYTNPIDLTYNEFYHYNSPVSDNVNTAPTSLFTVGTSVQLKERGAPQSTQAQGNAIFWL